MALSTTPAQVRDRIADAIEEASSIIVDKSGTSLEERITSNHPALRYHLGYIATMDSESWSFFLDFGKGRHCLQCTEGREVCERDARDSYHVSEVVS